MEMMNQWSHTFFFLFSFYYSTTNKSKQSLVWADLHAFAPNAQGRVVQSRLANVYTSCYLQICMIQIPHLWKTWTFQRILKL